MCVCAYVYVSVCVCVCADVDHLGTVVIKTLGVVGDLEVPNLKYLLVCLMQEFSMLSFNHYLSLCLLSCFLT